MASFRIHFDKQGNCFNIFTNGVVALRVKADLNTSTYRITDAKTGFQYTMQECVSKRQMVKYIRRDILSIFNMYKTTLDYDVGVMAQKITSVKKRRL